MFVPISSPHTEDPKPPSSSDLSSSLLVLIGVNATLFILQLTSSMPDDLLLSLETFNSGDRTRFSAGPSLWGDTTPES